MPAFHLTDKYFTMTNIDQTLETITQALRELAEAKNETAPQTITQFVEFSSKKGKENHGKGLIWSGSGYTKQLIFSGAPDRFFSTEHFDVARDRHFSIDNVPVLTATELGSGVTKSNLREVGRLKGLVVDGPISINQYLFYDATCDRLGLGIDSPNAAFSIAEMGVEVMLGTNDELHGMVGTYASTDFDIVTDNTSRISITAGGNIQLGNRNSQPIQVAVHGKLSVGVQVPDPSVDLHVNGSVKLNNRLQMYADTTPVSGNYGVGDIIWNANPRLGVNVGWVCVRAGNPGEWLPFGDIKSRP